MSTKHADKFRKPEHAKQEAPQDDMKSELDLLKEQYNELNNKLLLLAADYDNYRKRAHKEKEESARYSISKFAQEMIDVLENLYRAEDSINTEELESNETLKQIFTGVELTKKSLLDVLTRHGITRVYPLAEQFDHNFHQAIAEVPSSTHKTGEIVQVIQAGYLLHDRLIRPALVAVAKHSA